jgi:hypothetical protein
MPHVGTSGAPPRARRRANPRRATRTHRGSRSLPSSAERCKARSLPSTVTSVHAALPAWPRARRAATSASTAVMAAKAAKGLGGTAPDRGTAMMRSGVTRVRRPAESTLTTYQIGSCGSKRAWSASEKWLPSCLMVRPSHEPVSSTDTEDGYAGLSAGLRSCSVNGPSVLRLRAPLARSARSAPQDRGVRDGGRGGGVVEDRVGLPSHTGVRPPVIPPSLRGERQPIHARPRGARSAWCHPERTAHRQRAKGHPYRPWAPRALRCPSSAPRFRDAGPPDGPRS